ncbi:MAG: sulfurtransferase TusA family protein [Anaerolineaceae bacterium]|nr:sulfurtransferase TusA family protein [Anaerolineaceae bacterium]
MSVAADQVLDCSGMACPMPILKTKKAVDGLDVGQVLKMIATDPGSSSDMDAWTKKTGHELVGSEQDGDKYIFFIKKAKYHLNKTG